MPTVSVIIPAYNAEPFLVQTLQSVSNQTLDDIEIIVVDDGSTDRTWDIINSYADSRLVKLRKANGGVSSARNMGFEHVSGRYIQFLDADDVLHPRKLEAQVRRLEAAGDDCISTSKWGRFYRDIDDVKFVPEKNWTDLTPSDFAILEFGGGGTMPPNSWLMPRALIGSLRFDSIEAFEDDLFMAEMLTRTRQVVFASEFDLLLPQPEPELAHHSI